MPGLLRGAGLEPPDTYQPSIAATASISMGQPCRISRVITRNVLALGFSTLM